MPGLPSGMPVPPHIGAPADLVTNRDQTRSRFVDQAAEKTRRAARFVQSAGSLRDSLVPFPDVRALAEAQVSGQLDEALERKLFSAAGFSDKAISHCTVQELRPALADL